MKSLRFVGLLLAVALLASVSCKKKTDENPPAGTLHLSWVMVGTRTLSATSPNASVPVDGSFTVSFQETIDTSSARKGVSLLNAELQPVAMNCVFRTDGKSFTLDPVQTLQASAGYTLKIGSTIKGTSGETFAGADYILATGAAPGSMALASITIGGEDFSSGKAPRNVDFNAANIVATFTASVDTGNWRTCFTLSGGNPLLLSLSGDGKTVTVQNSVKLADITKHSFVITSSLRSVEGGKFGGFSNTFYTAVDSTPKFPVVSDDAMLDIIQQKTFRYFWDFGHPSCGMARERNTSGDIVTTGGSGFGVMALIVGMERGFVTRPEGTTRLGKILSFLETCDRFHGAWPHWINGATGRVVPFSSADDGADLVETSYMVQGLITMRQYLDAAVPAEQALIGRINTLLDAVEYDWFTRGQNVLYWHWSPNFGWQMNMQIRGYNETLITYVAAATSSTHPITAAVYTTGYARNGGIRNGNTYYGYVLPLGDPYGGPLFFTHYSFLGLKPQGLSDTYADYWQQNVNQSQINRAYCVANPKNWVGYGAACWGLTASDNPWGYNAHSPTNDPGVITPSAAVSALPYTPAESMKAIRYFYYTLGNRLFGEYGFYDSFDMTEGWWASSTLAIDQGPEICMIENYRTGLLWSLFMSAPEVQAGLTKLGFSY